MRTVFVVFCILFLLSHCGSVIKDLTVGPTKVVRNHPEVKQEDNNKVFNIATDDNSSKIAEGSNIKSGASIIRSFNISPDDIVYGDLNSPVVIIEYFSPTCTHCAYYKQKIFPDIKKHYIDTNKVAYVMREFIANRQDRDAAILARCTNNKEDFLKFMLVIIGQQDSWAYSSKYQEILTNIGTLGGISAEAYQRCLDNPQMSDMLLANSKLAMSSPKFVGTPAFFINGVQFTQPFAFEFLSKAIEDAINSTKVN
jgi:protein-disulfide isomerase